MLLLKLMVPNIEEQCVPSKHSGARGDLAVLLLLTGDAVCSTGQSLLAAPGQGLILSPWEASKCMGIHECTDRIGVSAPGKEASVEAALSHLEMQGLQEREKEAAKIAGSSQGVPCSSLVLWGGCLKGKEVVLL